MIYRVLSIDAWCDGQNCIECGHHRLSDTTKGTKLKCDSCLNEQDEDQGKVWSWNNWFNAGSYDTDIDGELTDENALKFFAKTYVINIDHFTIEDDQLNLVLYRRDSMMPVYAIEYGVEQ